MLHGAKKFFNRTFENRTVLDIYKVRQNQDEIGIDESICGSYLKNYFCSCKSKKSPTLSIKLLFPKYSFIGFTFYDRYPESL